MVVNWYGEGCFKIQSGNLTILTDPFDASTGLTPPRFRADITLQTVTSFPIPYEKGEQSIIAGPGEYEIKGVEVSGWAVESESKIIKSAYLAVVEDMRLAFLGHLSEMPDAKILEDLGAVDILFLPAGGDPYISQEIAAKLIKQINPKIVIPSFFKTPGLKRGGDDIKKFIEEIGKGGEPQEKLTIKKKELTDSLQVVVLKV